MKKLIRNILTRNAAVKAYERYLELLIQKNTPDSAFLESGLYEALTPNEVLVSRKKEALHG
jgi:hypothetical protein